MSLPPAPNPKSSHRAGKTRIWFEAVKPAARMLARPSTLAQLPRLFREGIGPARRLWVQAHNQRELCLLMEAGAPIGFVSSFARSGSTWTRNLLADAILQSHGMETGTDLPLPFQRIVPDYYCDLIVRRSASHGPGAALVKTHDGFPQLRDRLVGVAGGNQRRIARIDQGLRTCKFVYILRSPEDVLVSYYHMRRKESPAQRVQSIDAFCVEQLPYWMENVSSYLDAEKDGVQIHFVSYEDMLREPSAALSEVLTWLNISHDAAMTERAAAHMQFAKLRAKEQRVRPDASEFTYRRGCAGGGLEELQPVTHDEIRDRSTALLKRVAERLARQKNGACACCGDGQVHEVAALLPV